MQLYSIFHAFTLWEFLTLPMQKARSNYIAEGEKLPMYKRVEGRQVGRMSDFLRIE